MDQKAIAERLAQMRKNSGLSQSRVAQLTSVSRQAVSKWEKGDSSPSAENYSLLALLYHHSIDEIIKGEPFQEPSQNIDGQDDIFSSLPAVEGSSLAERFQFLRKYFGLSQTEAAQRLSVSRQSISKWERGEAAPDIDKIVQICELWNIPLSCLFPPAVLNEQTEDSGAASSAPQTKKMRLSAAEKNDAPGQKAADTSASDKDADEGGSDTSASDEGADEGDSDTSASDEGADEGDSDTSASDEGTDEGDSDTSASDEGTDAGGSDTSASDKDADEGGSDTGASDEGADKGDSDTSASDKDADKGGSSADRISYTDTVKPEEDKSNSIRATDKGNKKNACVTHAHLPSWVRPGHRRKPKEIKKKEPAFKSLSDIGPNDPAYVYIGKDNGKIRTMLPLLAVIPICVTAVALLIRRELNK